MSVAAISVVRIGHGAGTAGIMDAAGVIERSFGIEFTIRFLSAQLFCDGRNALAKRPCDSNFIIGDGP